jgi:hypothetical protein
VYGPVRAGLAAAPAAKPLITTYAHQITSTGVTTPRANRLMPVNPNRLLKIITAASVIVIASRCDHP